MVLPPVSKPTQPPIIRNNHMYPDLPEQNVVHCRSSRVSSATVFLISWMSEVTSTMLRFSPTRRSCTSTPNASPPSFRWTNPATVQDRRSGSEWCPLNLMGNPTMAPWTSQSEWVVNQHAQAGSNILSDEFRFNLSSDDVCQDPRGNLLRQWLDVEGVHGVVSKEFHLSKNPPVGQWSVAANVAVSVSHIWEPSLQLWPVQTSIHLQRAFSPGCLDWEAFHSG